MTRTEILDQLRSWESELLEIRGGFTHGRDGIHIRLDDTSRLRGIVVQIVQFLEDHVPDSYAAQKMIADVYSDGISNYLQSPSYRSVCDLIEIVVAVRERITRNPTLFDTLQQAIPGERELLAAMYKTLERFHAIATQLRHRHDQRETLDIQDEYDVQDLLHALLRRDFDDVRDEEWTPSFAGSSSRTDLYLPSISTFIEVKKTRPRLGDRELGMQLILDIEQFQSHPGCRRLVCFIYDPENRVVNAAGLRGDLEARERSISVDVVVRPSR